MEERRREGKEREMRKRKRIEVETIKDIENHPRSYLLLNNSV